MTAEAAAAYQNYGYGNVAPRPGVSGLLAHAAFCVMLHFDWDIYLADTMHCNLFLMNYHLFSHASTFNSYHANRNEMDKLDVALKRNIPCILVQAPTHLDKHR